MKIFITNDDGWGAKGILSLVETMRPLGDITVLAPNGPRSGQSSAFTVTHPLHIQKISEEPGLRVYTCDGTPCDCVKLGLQVFFPDSLPDLLCSGINHGDNGTVNILYSGTMGAVLEGAVHHITSIGWSICSSNKDADFSQMTPYIANIVNKIMSLPNQPGLCWNVNAPKGEINGVRIARHCMGYWDKEWTENKAEDGSIFYTIAGEYVNREPEDQETDQWLNSQGYISIAPTTIDMTDKETFARLRNMTF